MRNDGRHRRKPMGPLRTQQVENNGMMRPQPRTTSWIPLPLLGSSAKPLMFSLNSCYVLVDSATIYGMLSEKYTQYLVVFHDLFGPPLWTSWGVHGSYGKSLGFRRAYAGCWILWIRTPARRKPP